MGVAELRLANLPADSASARVLLTVARSSGYSVLARPAYVCAQVTLNSPEERLQAHRSATRKLQRTANAATKQGAITVEHRGNWEGFASEFLQFASAHVSRFLAADRLSNLVHPERRAFLIELARLLSARGWFTLSALKLRDRTIAWNYGFKYAGSWFWYQPAFDTEFEELSPGSHLLCEIIRKASQDPGVCIVDLGLGDEGYKQRYAS